MKNTQRNWLWIGGGLFLLGCLYYFSDIVTYLLLAWVLSMLGRPVMVFLQRRVRVGRFRLGQDVAALLTILVFYGVLVGFVLIFVPTIVEQARNLASVDYQALGEKFKAPMAKWDIQAHRLGLLAKGESLTTKAQELAGNWLKPTLLGDFVDAFVSTAGNIVVTLTAVTFILFFFLKDSSLFIDILHAFVPNNQETKVRHAVRESSEMMTRYFVGLVAQAFAFALSITVMLLLLGIPNALLIGVFGGLFNIIPYVGPILGAIFGCFITLSSTLDAQADLALLWPPLVKVLGAFAATQFLDNNFVGPMIFSNSVKAHPLEIFIVTLIAAKLGGIVGMVIGIPVYTVLRVIARVFFSELKLVQRLTNHLEEEGS